MILIFDSMDFTQGNSSYQNTSKLSQPHFGFVSFLHIHVLWVIWNRFTLYNACKKFTLFFTVYRLLVVF